MMEMTTYHQFRQSATINAGGGDDQISLGGFAASTIYGGSGADYILLHTAEPVQSMLQPETITILFCGRK